MGVDKGAGLKPTSQLGRGIWRKIQVRTKKQLSKRLSSRHDMEAEGEEQRKTFSDSDCDSDVNLMANTASEDSKSGCFCLHRTKGQYSPSHTHTVQPPSDRFNLLYICFFLAGAGFLFPFNSFVAAIDYFYCLYRAEFSAISEIIPVTYLVTTLLTSTLNLVLVERLSARLRISFGYVMFAISLFFVPLLDVGVTNGTVATSVSFYLTLTAVLIVGLGSGCEYARVHVCVWI